MNDDRRMKVFFLFTGSGSLVILTSYAAVDDPALLRKLAAKGIDKFLSYPIPLALARERYGKHFDVVLEDLSETDDLRVLDFNGMRAFRLFSFGEMGTPLAFEPQRGPDADTDAVTPLWSDG